jgi:DnaK suppressor protein
MIRQNDSAIRDLLASRLAALGARVGAIEDGFSQPLDDDFAEQAVDRENDEAQEALESAALAEIEQVRAALRRLDTGAYGICASCGNPISEKRLTAQPTAAQCIDCATTMAS